ncbi:hypothetical protein QBC41DRAFT_396310 [Cercophora samala]|uniref:DUF7730 domain-containing protein n=1 Tax=Cercophora samala TaxID=330535 RepID=A0AA39ZBF6_9PEZI|nr:hypothetical protein QBC41DRAFT_396310 [Cercophora samala]
MFDTGIRWPFSRKKPKSIAQVDLQAHEPLSPCLASPSPLATAKSPFFQWFPAEIREQILIEAFGKNAIHIHAELEYAEEDFRPPSPPPRKSRSRCNCSNPNPYQNHEDFPKNANEAYWRELTYHHDTNIPFYAVGEAKSLAPNPQFSHLHIIQPKPRWRVIPNSEDTGFPSAGIAHPTSQPTGPNQPRPTRWRFSSSICHRWLAISHRPPYSDQSSFSGRLFPWDDVCLHDGFMYAGDIPDTSYHTQQKCLIGATGFMLSCKQGYFEASRVLYERNLFHISSDLMLRRLPYILTRQRLESITTVELTWDLYPSRDYIYCSKHSIARQVSTFDDRLQGLGVMMDELAGRLPGLRKMWLCLQSNILPKELSHQEPNARLEAVEKVLKVIDSGIMRLSRLEDPRIAFSDSFFGEYGALSTTEMPKGCIARQTKFVQRWWRDLSDENVMWEEPDWRATAISWESLGRGYWIMPGKSEAGGYYRSNCGM